MTILQFCMSFKDIRSLDRIYTFILKVTNLLFEGINNSKLLWGGVLATDRFNSIAMLPIYHTVTATVRSQLLRSWSLFCTYFRFLAIITYMVLSLNQFFLEPPNQLSFKIQIRNSKNFCSRREIPETIILWNF